MLHECAARLYEAGAIVLAGRGREAEPLGIVRSILRTFFDVARDGTLAELRERLRWRLVSAAGSAGIARAIAVLEAFLLDEVTVDRR